MGHDLWSWFPERVACWKPSWDSTCSIVISLRSKLKSTPGIDRFLSLPHSGVAGPEKIGTGTCPNLVSEFPYTVHVRATSHYHREFDPPRQSFCPALPKKTPRQRPRTATWNRCIGQLAAACRQELVMVRAIGLNCDQDCSGTSAICW